jgi:Nickel responsive protein SCO4226-like
VSGPPELRLFLVEHDLRGLSCQQQSSAHQALGEAARRVARRGSCIRYVQRILIPEESRCLCLFEAAGAALVRKVNDIAQFPLARVVEVRNSAHPSTAPSHRPAAEDDTYDRRRP